MSESATAGLSDLDTGPGRLQNRLDTVDLAASTPDDESVHHDAPS